LPASKGIAQNNGGSAKSPLQPQRKVAHKKAYYATLRCGYQSEQFQYFYNNLFLSHANVLAPQSDKLDMTEAMPQVMDRQQAEHFYIWLEGKYLPEDQHDIEERIHAALRAYPDLLDQGLGWSEVLDYAD
jgi:hypothetical protein